MRALGAAIALVFCLGAAALAGSCPPAPAPTQATYRVLTRAYKLLEAGKAAEAGRVLKGFSQGGAVHHQVWFLRGVAAYRLKHYPEAARCFRAAIKAYRCFKEAWVNLGVVLFETKRYKQAAQAMLQAFSLSQPPEYELVYQAGMMLLAGGEHERALKVLSSLEKLSRPRWRWLAGIARAHMELKQWEPAARVLMRALELAPLEPRLWKMLAGAYAGGGAYLKAAVALEVARWIRPPATPAGWRRLAQVWAGAGVAAKAAYYYRKAMDSPPTPGQLTHLARLLAQAGRTAQACKLLEKALKLGPTQRRWALLGRLRMAMGQWAAAARAFERAGRLAKGRRAGRYLVSAGWCWWNAGNLGQAAAVLKAAAAAAPASREATSARRLLAQLTSYRKVLEGR